MPISRPISVLSLGLVCAAPSLAALVHTATAPAPLRYIESSYGLDWPGWDTGRSEVEMADLNGDGHPDLVSIGDHGNPYVNTQEHGIMAYLGDGAGHWQVHQTGDFGYGGIAVGDLNWDGLEDVVYGMHHNYSGVDLGDQLIEAALGDGTGYGWTAWDDGLATNGESWGMFCTDLADVDGDGLLDLAANSFGSGSGVHVYRSLGDGSWDQTFGFLGGNSTMDLSFGDVNADGAPDLCAANEAGTIWINDGMGGFALGDGDLPPAGGLGRRGPSLGDVDGDGRDDLAVVTGDGGLSVWLARGAGHWQEVSFGLPSAGDFAVTQLHDMNGDGQLDLAAFGGGQFVVYRPSDSGWRSAAHFETPTPGNYTALRVGGDVDHNGRPDIALVAEQGGFLNRKNHLRVFREASVATEPRIRFTNPGPARVLRAGAVIFVHYAAAIPRDLISSASVDLDISYAGDLGPWEPLVLAHPPSGRFQTIIPAPPPGPACFMRLTLHSDLGAVRAISAELELR